MSRTPKTAQRLAANPLFSFPFDLHPLAKNVDELQVWNLPIDVVSPCLASGNERNPAGTQFHGPRSRGRPPEASLLVTDLEAKEPWTPHCWTCLTNRVLGAQKVPPRACYVRVPTTAESYHFWCERRKLQNRRMPQEPPRRHIFDREGLHPTDEELAQPISGKAPTPNVRAKLAKGRVKAYCRHFKRHVMGPRSQGLYWVNNDPHGGSVYCAACLVQDLRATRGTTKLRRILVPEREYMAMEYKSWDYDPATYERTFLERDIRHSPLWDKIQRARLEAEVDM